MLKISKLSVLVFIISFDLGGSCPNTSHCQTGKDDEQTRVRMLFCELFPMFFGFCPMVHLTSVSALVTK